MKTMASWMMDGMMNGLVAVLAAAGFGKSETGGNPMKPKEGRIMKMKSNLVFASVVLMAALGVFVMGGAQSVSAEVPGTISYQGYLEDSGGNPLNETVGMVFKIYDANGTERWSEAHGAVDVADGIFSVILGEEDENNGISTDVAEGERYLGVTVGDNEEMLPRQKLNSVAFAIRSGVAELAESVADGAIVETDPTVPENLKDGVSWDEVSDKPAESDPTVPEDLKDGVSWNEVTEKPGVVTTESDPTISESLKDGVSWDEVSDKPDVVVTTGGDLSVAGTIESTDGGIKFPDETVQTTASVFSVSNDGTPVTKNLNVTDKLKVGKNSINLGTTAPGLDNSIATSPGSGDLLVQSEPGNNQNTIINANNAGKVGIGMADPKAKLDVKGVVRVSNHTLSQSDIVEGLLLNYETGFGKGADIFSTNGLYAYLLPRYNKLAINGNPITINATSASNVGIGTDDPQANLHIYGESNPNIKLDAAIWSYPPYPPNMHHETFEIGVATCNGCFAPYAKEGDAIIRKLGSSHNIHLNMPNDNNDGESHITFGDDHNGATMNVLNNGRVGIGTIDATAKLTINGGNSHALHANVYHDHDWGYSIISTVSRDNTKAFAVRKWGDDTDKFRVMGDGDVYCRTQKIHSDIKLKKDIKPIESSLEKVLKMRGVTFRFKDREYASESEREMGFIAQEVEAIVPEVVNTNPDDGLKSVAYQNLVALTVEAMKEQQSQIEELKEENDALKAIICEEFPEKAICH